MKLLRLVMVVVYQHVNHLEKVEIWLQKRDPFQPVTLPVFVSVQIVLQ
jgi:hypothetical protein